MSVVYYSSREQSDNNVKIYTHVRIGKRLKKKKQKKNGLALKTKKPSRTDIIAKYVIFPIIIIIDIYRADGYVAYDTE